MLLGAARLVAITSVHFARYALRRARLVDASPRELRRVQGEATAALLESLGPTYVKLGQVLSTRPDVIGTELANGLSRLQEHVRPLSARTAARAVSDGLGSRLSQFASVAPVPIASGSIAQVHRATTLAGEEVILKIRRPGIAHQIERDVSLMLWLTSLVERWLRFPASSWIEEFANAVRSQLDLKREAEAYNELRSNLACLPNVYVPKPVLDLSSDTVLALEYVGNLCNVGSRELSVADRRQALRAGLDALYRMIFVHGFIHADLHPGNVFFRKGGDCVFLDAGIMARLDERVRRDFCDFFFGLVANRGDECARIIWDNASVIGDSVDRRAFEADVRALVNQFSKLPARDFEVTAFAARLFEIQHQHQVHSAPDFMMTIVALLGYEGIVKRVDPEMDFQSIAFDVLSRARAASVASSHAAV